MTADHSQNIETLQRILQFYSKGQVWFTDQPGDNRALRFLQEVNIKVREKVSEVPILSPLYSSVQAP